MRGIAGGSALQKIALATLLLFAAFIQFSVVLSTRVDSPIRADAAKYVSYAYNLKQAGTFSHEPTWLAPDGEARAAKPDKLTLPGYPVFLSLFLDGTPDAAFIRRATLAQAALGVLSTLLAFLIARQLLPFAWAFGAGLLTAISPHIATISTYLLTEALFTALLLASVLAILLAARPGASPWRYAAAGVLVGVACLVRPQLQLLPLVLLVIVACAKQLRPRLPGLLLATACFAATLAPWHARNATVEQSGGDLLVNTLYHGSFPNMMYRNDPRTYGFPYRFDPDIARITRDLPSVVEHIGTLFAREPLRYTNWYLIGKPGFFLSWGIIAGGGDIYIYPTDSSPYRERALFRGMRAVSLGLHWPLMLLALFAMFATLARPKLFLQEGRRRTATVVLSIVFAYALAMHAIGAPFPRYGIPFRPLAFALAVVALHALWVRWTERPAAAAANATPTPNDP